ncbi:hypothetical protein Hamer_G027575, partial [Homarus americanus]
MRCLCAAWRPLWPECVLQREFEGFEELEEEAVVHEIVSLGNSMGLEVDDDDDVEELVEEHSKELSTEELLELHKEENETLKQSLTSEESGEDEDKEESRIIPAKDLKDVFFCWRKLSKLAEDYHPDVGSVEKAITWKEVTVRCLCAAWRPLWPECVLQRDFEGFEELEEEAVVHEIVSLGNSMGLEMDDVEELVEEHSKELSTEELLELHKKQNETLKRSLTSEESGEDEDKEESHIIPAKDLKDAFFCWSKLSKLAEDYHPDVGSVQKAISVFNDNVMNCFWK